MNPADLYLIEVEVNKGKIGGRNLHSKITDILFCRSKSLTLP